MTNRTVYIALGVLGLFFLLSYGSTIQSNTNSVLSGKGFTQTGSNAGGLCAAGLPVQFTVLNAFSGSGVNAPTMNIYSGSIVSESPTVSSSGVATTGGSYNTGTNLIVKLSGASTVTEFLPFTVPPITCGSNQANNIVKIYTITLGAWTITATGQGGTTFTSGLQYFVSQLPGGSSGTSNITFLISETTANAGYHSSVDIINSLVQNMVIQVKDTGTALSISGFPRLQMVGTTRYWLMACGDGLSGTGYGTGTQGAFAAGPSGDSQGATSTNPATGSALTYPSGGPDSQCTGSLSQQTVGVNVNGGSLSFTFGVATGSLAANTNEALVVTMNDYASITYFQAQTSLGPNAAAVGAPQGSSQGTAFTLNLKP